MVSKLDLYRVFYQVGKSKSFSKASKELFMTQPAVSQAIMHLEEELGIRLFNRTPKGVSLTNEGKVLYEYVNSIKVSLKNTISNVSVLKHDKNAYVIQVYPMPKPCPRISENMKIIRGLFLMIFL